jgi:hypothetical protein
MGGAVVRQGDGVHPAGKVLLASLFNKGVTVNLNVVVGLGDVNPIKHVKITLVLDRNGDAFV